MGSAPARKAADFSASGRLRSKPRSSEITTESGRRWILSIRQIPTLLGGFSARHLELSVLGAMVIGEDNSTPDVN